MKEEIIRLRSKYEEIYKILNGLSILIGENLRNMDLTSMNKWLVGVINFYKQAGKEIGPDDFRVPSNIPNYKRTNEIIDSYMEVFFRNINTPDSEEFRKTLFDMKDLELTSEYTNPIYDEINAAITSLHMNNASLFNKIFKYINESHLKISEVTYSNILDVKLEVSKKMQELDDELDQIESDEKYEEVRNQELNRFYMLITNNKYDKMNDEEKQGVKAKTLDIAKATVKLRIFNNIKTSYLEYSVNHSYDKLLILYKKREILIKKLKSKLDRENEALKNEKLKLFRVIREKRILNLNKQLLKVTSEVNEKISEYLKGFYDKYNIKKFSNMYDINDMDNESKLFGIFDFDKLPPSSNTINEMIENISCGINIPNEDSQEFITLSNLALGFITKNIVTDREEKHKKKQLI